MKRLEVKYMKKLMKDTKQKQNLETIMKKKEKKLSQQKGERKK